LEPQLEKQLVKRRNSTRSLPLLSLYNQKRTLLREPSDTFWHISEEKEQRGRREEQMKTEKMHKTTAYTSCCHREKRKVGRHPVGLGHCPGFEERQLKE
jgi:hypothetical protein